MATVKTYKFPGMEKDKIEYQIVNPRPGNYIVYFTYKVKYGLTLYTSTVIHVTWMRDFDIKRLTEALKRLEQKVLCYHD